MIQRLVFLFALILAFSLIALVSLKYTYGDFDVYYYSSQDYLAKAPIYGMHAGINEFKYSPLFVFLFSPLALINEESAFYVWTIFNIFCFYAIFLILYKLKQFSLTNFKDFLIIICLFALAGRYIFINFRLGQVNVFLCLLMVLTMYFEINKKYFLASVVLALGLMIKFFPLLFVFYFLLRRRFKLLAYTFLMAGIFLFLPSVYTGFSLNLKYLHDWFVILRSTPASMLYSFRNNSLLSFFSWFFVVRHEHYIIFDYNLIKRALTPEVYFAWVISCLIFFITFFYDAFFIKNKASEISYLDYSCLFVCGLLFNPLAYLNALIFLIIPYFFLLRHLFYSRSDERQVFVTGAFVSLAFILTMIDNKVFFKNLPQFYAFLEFKPLMWVIILVYISLLSAKFPLKLKS